MTEKEKSRPKKKHASRAAGFLAAVTALFILASCGKPEKVPQTDRLYPSNSYHDVVSIKITDTTERKYREPLDITLSDEEVEMFHSVMNNHEEPAASAGSTNDVQPLMGDYYSMHLVSAGGKEKIWTVDLTHEVTIEDGSLLQTDPLLEQWMVSVETEHGITYSSVLDRAPGQHYFSRLLEADMAVLEEMPDKDRTDLKRKTFTPIETSVIAESISNAVKRYGCTNVQEDPDIRWKLSLYKNGALLYEFEMDAGGKVYENRYRILTESLEGIYQNLISLP